MSEFKGLLGIVKGINQKVPVIKYLTDYSSKIEASHSTQEKNDDLESQTLICGKI